VTSGIACSAALERVPMSKGIYVAGSDKDAGKTMLSLGLIAWFGERLEGRVTFMKPLGQKTLLRDGKSVGQDTFLVNSSLGLDVPFEYSAPFTMTSGAAREYIESGGPPGLKRRVVKAYKKLSSMSEMVVVEGTGHPGVGSVFGMCNAGVARLLGLPVLMILEAGIGSTIDRFTLCSSLFREESVPILGVVINRVAEGKLDKVKKYLDPWFAKLGITVFGYIPYVGDLCRPSLGMMGRELGFHAEPGAGSVEGFIAGFGGTGEILDEIAAGPGSVLLLSAGREEVLDAIVARKLSGILGEGPGAVVLCGGSEEKARALGRGFHEVGIPLYHTEKSAGDSISILNRRVFKVEPGETPKIDRIVRLIRENVDLEGMMERLREPAVKPPPPRYLGKIRSLFGRIFGTGGGNGTR